MDLLHHSLLNDDTDEESALSLGCIARQILAHAVSSWVEYVLNSHLIILGFIAIPYIALCYIDVSI